jgi:hypothetical protein
MTGTCRRCGAVVGRGCRSSPDFGAASALLTKPVAGGGGDNMLVTADAAAISAGALPRGGRLVASLRFCVLSGP